MRKLEGKVLVTIGFHNESKRNVEMVMDTTPSHEKIELLADLNQADYIDIGTRYVPVEG